MDYFPCQFCKYSSKYKSNVKRHEKNVHKFIHEKAKKVNNISNIGTHTPQNETERIPTQSNDTERKKPIIVTANGKKSDNVNVSFDIRLKENFKIFVSGPSGSGKTYFLTELIRNIHNFAKDPPKCIIYVYRIWQPKYREMDVDYFIEDGVNLYDNVKSYSKGLNTLIIFDDLINSPSIPKIAQLFTVDGRHSNFSLVFVTQKMFVNDEKFREISGNSDYFIVFKNPRNSREIRTLSSQMTPGKMDLVNYYEKATERAFSYIFINVTQQCNDQVKFLSHLFDTPHVVRVYFNSTYLSLHDDHRGEATNFSSMFMTNEIVEDCNCNNNENKDLAYDEHVEESSVQGNENEGDLLPNLRPTNKETKTKADTNIHVPSNKEHFMSVDEPDNNISISSPEADKEPELMGMEMTNTDHSISIPEANQQPESVGMEKKKIDPIKIKRLFQVKKATPRRLIISKNYEIGTRSEKLNQKRQLKRVEEHPELALDPSKRRQLFNEIQRQNLKHAPYNTAGVKLRQKRVIDVNNFGGSYSVESWEKQNQNEIGKRGFSEIIDGDKNLDIGKYSNEDAENERLIDLGESMQIDGSEMGEYKAIQYVNENIPAITQDYKDENENLSTTTLVNHPKAKRYEFQLYTNDGNEKIESDEFQLYDDLQCPICEEVFKSKVVLNKHKNSCKVTSYACLDCGVNFMSRNGLKSHTKSVHSVRNRQQDKMKEMADKFRN